MWVALRTACGVGVGVRMASEQQRFTKSKGETAVAGQWRQQEAFQEGGCVRSARPFKNLDAGVVGAYLVTAET